MQTKFLILSLFAISFLTLNAQDAYLKGKPCFKVDTTVFTNLKALPFKPDSNITKMKIPFENFRYVICEKSEEKFVAILFIKYYYVGKTKLPEETFQFLYNMKGQMLEGNGLRKL